MSTFRCGIVVVFRILHNPLINILQQISCRFTQDQFSDPGNANQTEYLFSHMQRIDSLFVPGGDGGPVLSPADFVAVVAQVRFSVSCCESFTS
jgi:hypothetical protein